MSAATNQLRSTPHQRCYRSDFAVTRTTLSHGHWQSCPWCPVSDEATWHSESSRGDIAPALFRTCESSTCGDMTAMWGVGLWRVGQYTAE